MNMHPKAVLISGAGSGIGRATAELLASAGFRVFGGVRRPGPDEPLPEVPPGVAAVELDVTSPENVAAVVARLEIQSPGGLFALVNNAGVAPPAPVELIDLDELRRVLEVNTLAPLRLIQACLPLLRRGGGRVVNMSSLNGSLAMPMVGAYSASKFALEALSDALRVELRPWGIPVTTIRPGQVRTAIFAKAQIALDERAKAIPPELKDGYDLLYARARRFNQRGAESRTSPERVARAVLRALQARRPRRVYLVGIEALGLQLARNHFPRRLMDWILAAAMGSNRRAGVRGPAGGETITEPALPPLLPALPDTLRSSG